MEKKEAYTLPEIAKMLHITVPEVENYIESGSLKTISGLKLNGTKTYGKTIKGSKKDSRFIRYIDLIHFLRYYSHKTKKKKTTAKEEKRNIQVKQLPVEKIKSKKKKKPISLLQEKQISKEKPKKVIQKLKPSKAKKTIFKPELRKAFKNARPLGNTGVTPPTHNSNPNLTKKEFQQFLDDQENMFKKENRNKKVIIEKEKKSIKKPLSLFSKIKHFVRKS